MKTVVSNKKVLFDYFIIETETSGISLFGSEVKPIKNGHTRIKEAFIYIDSNYEMWIKNMWVENSNKNAYSHEEIRDRKLLLKKKQIKKWASLMELERLTIVPVSIIINDNNLLKIEISLVKGKKLYDKRNSLKENDMKKQINRALKNEE